MPSGGGSYEIRIKGRLSDSLVAAFEGRRPPLYGPVPDQSALYGLLDRISR
jgi:hypothetical protein